MNNSIFRRDAITHYSNNRFKTVLPRFTKMRGKRVPIILQLNAIECGAACLAMILTAYGRKTRVAECRECMGVGRDGVSALEIVQTARNFGLQVRAYSVQELGDFQHVSLPAVIHWEFNHFVVVERWSPQKVEIVDPGLGRRQLTMDEFAAGFTGVAITFETGPQFATRKQYTSSLPWMDYLKQVLSTPGLLVQVLFISLFLQGVALLLPFFNEILIDNVLPNRNFSLLSIMGLMMVGIVLVQTGFSYVRSRLLITLQTRLDARIMQGFFEHLLALPFKFFQERNTGDLLMRLNSNATLRQVLTDQLLSSVLDGSLALISFLLLLHAAPWMALLALAIGLLQMMLLVGSTRWTHNATQRTLVAQAEAQGYLVEALAGVETVKAAGAEDRVLDRWLSLFHHELHTTMQSNQLNALLNTLLGGLHNLTPLLLLWTGVYYVSADTLALGEMISLQILAISFLTPLASLLSSARQLQLMHAHLERLADVLQETPEQILNGIPSAPRLSGKIELQNVSFRYAPTLTPAVSEINLTIEPGQKVAIVGRSGSGKSTLAKLLLGLYQPNEGIVCYDGHSLTQFNIRTLRNQLGIVMQDAFLFSGSIRENIALHSPEMDYQEVIAAAKLAAIHTDIVQMPMGYETRVAEGGSGLSGGQRQRLSLARALAHQPAILLLDEATSHLDTLNEQQVDTNLSALHCTRIVIAHRLSTIRNADLILVMADGQVVESGTHAELIKRSGFYAELVSAQH